MENTLVIFKYAAKEMRKILDNLVVWDGIKKVHYRNVVTYTEEKHVWSTGSGSTFTITALKEAPLVFFTIGLLADMIIDAPLRANMPRPGPPDKGYDSVTHNAISKN